MFSEKLKDYIRNKWSGRKGLLDELGITAQIAELPEQEQVLAGFLYVTLPLRDVGEYDFAVFRDFLTHGVYLRENNVWCRELAEDKFLHYVFYPRINTEGIEPCRTYFYSELKERVKGLTLEQAVLEVNYWCCENATYKASDDRTLSAMAVYRSGDGRCGEESVFTVSALRSVGIPARQVYAPWWAHCDDNHAWVEVLLEDGWHFLGACEPEEVLNRGWFTYASSRAVIVHSRTFGDYPVEGEEYIGREGIVSLYNSTPFYGNCKKIKIILKDEEGRVLPGEKIRLKVLNMAAFRTVAELVTDIGGEATVTLGQGTILVEAAGVSQLENTAQCSEITLVRGNCCSAASGQGLESGHSGEEGHEIEECQSRENGAWLEAELHAPCDSEKNIARLTQEQSARKQRKVDRANAVRTAKSRKNPELERFTEGKKDELRQKLLRTLRAKDEKDCRAEVLEDHLVKITEGQEDTVLCPWVHNEELTAYRAYLLQVLPEKKQTEYREYPWNLWRDIEENITEQPEEDYAMLEASPAATLKLKSGNLESRRILFVAICRTLGIPARRNPVGGCAEYEKDGRFQSVEHVGGKAQIVLKSCENLRYGQDFSLEKLGEDRNCLLTAEGLVVGTAGRVMELDAGDYRICVTFRLPDGNQLLNMRYITIGEGETAEVELYQRKPAIEDMLVDYELEDWPLELVADGKNGTEFLTGGDTQGWEITEGVSVSASKFMEQGGLLAILETGKEPTEHVLNELREAYQCGQIDFPVAFVLGDRKEIRNATLRSVLAGRRDIRIAIDPGLKAAEPIARRMYVNPEKLPLLVLLEPGLRGRYAVSGYHVGSVDFMIKLHHMLG